MQISTAKALIDAGATTGVKSQTTTQTTTDKSIENAKALIKAGM